MKLAISIGVALATLFAVPAVAGTNEAGVSSGVVVGSSAYTGRRDRAYWTRVWYRKQAARKARRNARRSSRRTKVRRASVRRNSKAVRAGGGSGRITAVVDKSSQSMSVYQGGRRLYSWRVSTGRKGYGTPTGTWSVKRMHKEYYSRKYDGAPMPYAMFYNGGFAVHATYATKRLGRPASHGCVRLAPGNAAKLFALVRRHGGTVKVKW